MLNRSRRSPTGIHSERGLALLTSLFILVVLSMLLAVAFLRSEMQMRRTAQRKVVQEAFYSAEAGLERAVFELRRNPTWRPGEGGEPAVVDARLNLVPNDDTTTIGFYSLTIADGETYNGWDTLWIRSIGRDSLQELTRVITARVIVENPARFLVSTMGDLRIGSGAKIETDILGKDVYFDVNTALQPEDQKIEIDGDVFYISSINNANHPAIEYGPDSEIHQSPSITFAGVDVGRYRDLADKLSKKGEGVYDSGDLTVDLSNLDALGNQPNFKPLLIFAEGDITISGEYEHSLLVVAGGNVYIEGDITPDAMQTVRPQIGIFAKKDLIIPAGAVSGGGDLELEAFVMADGDGASDGIFFAEGAKGSLGTLSFKGAIAVRGAGRTGVDLNAFSVRDYKYNLDLTANRTIPFSPFIVNVIEWNETPLNADFPPPPPSS